VKTITVATLNRLHGLPRFEYLEEHKALILAELERLAPDVILMQEFPILRSRQSRILPGVRPGKRKSGLDRF